MSSPIVIPAGGGEIVGDSPDRRVEILGDHEALHATWSRFGPGRDGADLHIHRRHTDFFYVLRGELTVMLGTGNEEVTVPAGTLVRVPALVVHGFRNGSDEQVRYLNFHAPGEGFASFMRGLQDGRHVAWDDAPPPADGGRSTSEVAIGEVVSVTEAPGYRETVLADTEAIEIAEVRGDPGPLPPLPRECRSTSLFVLEGELLLGGVSALAGAWVRLAPDATHTFMIAGPEPARYLRLSV